MAQVLQWIGAMGVLVAYALSQFGMWRVVTYRYLIFNFVGGATLCAAAVMTRQWGFVLLEGVWAIVAARGIIVRLSGRELHAPGA